MEIPNVFIMVTIDGFYSIEASGKIPIKDEAKDHLFLNGHIIRVENINGEILADRNN